MQKKILKCRVSDRLSVQKDRVPFLHFGLRKGTRNARDRDAAAFDQFFHCVPAAKSGERQIFVQAHHDERYSCSVGYSDLPVIFLLMILPMRFSAYGPTHFSISSAVCISLAAGMSR